jgi:hypothetical protein
MTDEIKTIPEAEEETDVQLDSLSDVEPEEMPPPKRPRGRPKGKAKPKEQPKKERPPKLQVPPQQLDMNALTRMLAEHLAGEKQTARAKRHESWDSFF